MHLAELTHLGTVGLAGAVARSMARGLPDAVRLRLEARPAEGLMPGWIWLHAVSVGELLLAQGLIGLLRDEGHAIHVTTGTRAGMSLLATRLPGWDGGTGRVTGGAFPLDDPEGLAPFLARYPTGFGRYLAAAEFALGAPKEIALVGEPTAPDTLALREVLDRPFLPNQVVLLRRPSEDPPAIASPLLADRAAIGGRATAYVCQNYACQLPVTTPEQLRAQLEHT